MENECSEHDPFAHKMCEVSCYSTMTILTSADFGLLITGTCRTAEEKGRESR